MKAKEAVHMWKLLFCRYKAFLIKHIFSKMKKTTFQSTLYNFHDSLWHYHLKVPADIATPYITDNRRIFCQVGQLESFSCALMPDGKGNFFINLNKERRKQLGLKIGDTVEVTIHKDESKYGLPMPEEMEVLLEQDEEANHYFHTLTPGKQRTLLHMIGKPKTEATRLKKAIVITEYLKTNKGKLDYKELNIAFKEYNGQ